MGYEWHDLVGNVGVVFVLATYLLVQTGRMDVRRVSYSALNALGAALIIVSLLRDFNLSSFVIEIAWLAISLYGLLRWLRSRRRDLPSVS